MRPFAAGGLLGSYAGFPIADPIAGMLTMLFILRMAGDIGETALRELTDASVSHDYIEKLSAIASDGGDQKVERVRARQMGRYTVVDMIVEVDKEKTMKEVADISASIRQRITVY